MGDLKVKYLPTEKMLSVHFTKSLEGTDLRKFRAKIQGIPEDIPDTYLGWDRSESLFITIP